MWCLTRSGVFRLGPSGTPCAVCIRVSCLKIVVHNRLPVRTVSYLAPLSVTSLACLMGVCLLWAYLYRFAVLGATATVHNGWLRWLDPSCRVTCRLRFLPWFLVSWRHRFYTIWRMSAGPCLG